VAVSIDSMASEHNKCVAENSIEDENKSPSKVSDVGVFVLRDPHVNKVSRCEILNNLFILRLIDEIIIYLLLNRTRSTEYSMKIDKLSGQLARANVRNNVVQFVAR